MENDRQRASVECCDNKSPTSICLQEEGISHKLLSSIHQIDSFIIRWSVMVIVCFRFCLPVNVVPLSWEDEEEEALMDRDLFLVLSEKEKNRNETR